MKDIIGGSIFLVLSVVWLVQSGSIRDPGFDELGPAFLPRFVLVPIVVLSLWQIWSGWRELRMAEGDESARIDLASMKKPLMLLALLTGFIWAVAAQAAPFELSGGIFVLLSGLAMSGLGNRQLVAWIVLTALILPMVVGYVFKTLLFVNLP